MLTWTDWSNGDTFRWRAKGDDGTQLSPAWSSWCEFTVDVNAPSAPTVSSTTYPAGSWAGGVGTSGSFALTPGSDTGSSGTSGVQWSLDGGTPTTVSTTGSAVNVAIVPSTDGKHVLSLNTLDKAGNVSTPPTTHTFYAGAGGFTKPASGARTAGSFDVAAIVKDAAAVQFQWRRGETETTWTNIGGQVTVSSGATAPFPWDAASALSGDGTVQLRALLVGGTAGGTGTAPISVTVDQLSSQAAGEEVGPGGLDLLTGDYAISATDASFFGVALSRSARSRDPQAGTRIAGQVAPFGPAWATGGVAEVSASDWTNVAVSGAAATLTASDGSKISFTKTNPDLGSGTVWKPEVGAEDLTLTGSSTTGFTLRDSDAAVTVFAGPSSGPFQVASNTLPGASGNETLYTWESAGGGLTRLARIIAPTTPVSTLSNCGTGTTPPAGCRVLQLNYASSGTTPPASGTTGDYAGRVKSLTVFSMAPSTGTTVGTDVAAYAYDHNGRLAQAWDPRISPALETVYGYDADGRVTGATPPGERAWTFAYDTSGSIGSVNNGRLLSVTRDTLVGPDPTATTSVVYSAPLSGGSAAADLSAGTVASWGQSDVPVTATAIFPPDAVRTTHYGAQGSWTKATVHYLNVDGREVNTLSPGGGIDTVEHDSFGNTTRELSASNLALAQASSDPQLLVLGLSAASTAVRAQALSSTSVYDPTGQQLLESFGPLHVVALSDGGTSAVRAHTVNVYDQGHPGGNGPKSLVTSTSVGARPAGATADVDVRTATTEYDWTLGLPTKTAVDPGTGTGDLNIATVTAYDTRGRVIRTDMPKAAHTGSTTGADSTIIEYYATGTNPSACQKSAWEGLLCRTTPGGAITGGGSNPNALPSTYVTYDHLGQEATFTETSGSTTRTTTTTYASGRTDTVATSGSGMGAAVPTVQWTYDSTTGRVVSTKDVSVTPNTTISREYDDLGRETAYADADGGRTETVYNWLGQVASTKQYSNGTTPLTTTYSYDADRKLLTGLVDPVAGTFSATYDLDGQLLSQGMPGGVSMTQTLDPTGAPLTRSYAAGSAVLMTETVAENVHGQWVTRARADKDAAGSDQAYGYDKNGRLTSAGDTAVACTTTRAYGFDRNSNRTSFTTTLGAGCTGTAPAPVNPTYDSADRLIAPGYVYDNLGRTTTAPLPNGAATLEYHANDLIRRQTIGTQRQTWIVDPAMRLRGWTTETQTGAIWNTTGTKINHYYDDSDSPAWIDEGAGAITRTITSISGDLAATTTATGSIKLQLATVHGDVGQQIALSNSTTIDTGVPTVLRDADEYGNDKANGYDQDGNPVFNTARYGWLGAKERSTETIGSTLTLMGVRLYNPATGRFLSVDPVAGGNANAYTYPADPVNLLDLDGRSCVPGSGTGGDFGGTCGGIGGPRGPVGGGGSTGGVRSAPGPVKKKSKPGSRYVSNYGGDTRTYGKNVSDIKGQAKRYADRMKKKGYRVTVGKVRYKDGYGDRADVTVVVTNKHGKIVARRHFITQQSYAPGGRQVR